jgi:hypothetical protein
MTTSYTEQPLEPIEDRITEADVADPVSELEWLSAEELAELAADWDYFEEVRSCCGGRRENRADPATWCGCRR